MKPMKSKFLIPMMALAGLLLTSELTHAHGVPAPSLRGIKPPKTPGLVGGEKSIIVSQKWARILGKALFWDMNVGSDGTACATCHYHAGADERSRNQLNTGDLDQDRLLGLTFQPTKSGGNPDGRNNTDYQYRKSDFPFWSFQDPDNNQSPLLFSTDDVSGSSGTFMARLQAVAPAGVDHDACASVPDLIYHQPGTGKNTRQVTNRNAPTVINAAYNHRNFWDGRANNIFNGETAYGARDVDAGIWVVNAGGQLERQTLRMENASLASQAMAPALSDVEMSCRERTLPELGRKLLGRRALESQKIHPQDSVLADVRHASGKGLTQTYQTLIQTAFAPRYWAGKTLPEATAASGTAAYSQIEANFSMFSGWPCNCIRIP